MGYRLGRIVVCISLMGRAAWGQPAIGSYGDGYVNAPTQSAPGGQLIINGAKLASSAVDCTNGGLPLLCGNTWVTIGGYSAPLLYVSPAKLIVYVPYEANGSSLLYVHSDLGANTSNYVNVVPALPYAGMGFSDNGVLVSGQSPANAGDTVSLVATGLGAVNPPPTDGMAIPFNSPYHSVGPVQVTVGGVLAKIVSPATFPDGIVNASYNHTISAGGSGATSWQAPNPELLPPGLTLNSNGSITGTPANQGEYAFPVVARNNQGGTQKTVTLSVYSACDPLKAGFPDTADVVLFVRSALGAAPPANDVTNDGKLNVVDIQAAIQAAFGRGCQ